MFSLPTPTSLITRFQILCSRRGYSTLQCTYLRRSSTFQSDFLHIRTFHKSSLTNDVWTHLIYDTQFTAQTQPSSPSLGFLLNLRDRPAAKRLTCFQKNREGKGKTTDFYKCLGDALWTICCGHDLCRQRNSVLSVSLEKQQWHKW